MSFFGIDSELTNPLNSDVIGDGYSITGLSTVGATDADITNLQVLNQTITNQYITNQTVQNEIINNTDITNLNTTNIYTTEMKIGDAGYWVSDGTGALLYDSPDNDATILAQTPPPFTLTNALAGNFQYTIANSETYIADAIVGVWGAGNQWGAGSALITTFDLTSVQYTITSPTPGLENFGQSVYMGPDGSVVFVGTGTGNVNAGANGVYVFDYLPSSSPVYTQTIGTGLQNPVVCVLNDDATRPTIAVVAGGHLGSGGGDVQIWKWDNTGTYLLDQSFTIPQGGDGVYAPPMNGYAMKKMNNGGFLVSNLNTYATENASGYKVFKYDVSGSSYVLSETINIPRVGTDINYGSLESNGKDIIVVSFNSSAGAGRTVVYKNTTTSPYVLTQTINQSGYVIFPKETYGTILIIADKVDAGLALGQYYIRLYTSTGAGTYTIKSTTTAPTNTLSASVGAGGIISTIIGDGSVYLYLGYGKEPVGGGGTGSGTNSIVSRYTLSYYGAPVIIKGPLQGDLLINQTVLQPGSGVVNLQENQLGQGWMVNVVAGPFPTIYLPLGTRNGSWVMFQQTSALSCQIIDQYNNVIGTTSQNQWKRVIYNAVSGTWAMDGSNFSNPLNENIDGGGVYGIVGANEVEGLTVKTDTITLTPGSLLTSVQVNENLRMASTKAVEFSGDIELKHVGAGTAVKIDSIPAGVQANIVGFNTSTRELTYFATPSGGGTVVGLVAGSNISIDNTNPATPGVSLSEPTTSPITMGQQLTMNANIVMNGDIQCGGNDVNGISTVETAFLTPNSALSADLTINNTTGNTYITTSSGNKTIITNGSTTGAVVQIINNDANSQPVGVEFYKSNRNLAQGDTVAEQLFIGKDGGGQITQFGAVKCVAKNVPSGNEDGSIGIWTCVNGTPQEVFIFNGADNENNSYRPIDMNNNDITSTTGTLDLTTTGTATDIRLNPSNNNDVLLTTIGTGDITLTSANRIDMNGPTVQSLGTNITLQASNNVILSSTTGSIQASYSGNSRLLINNAGNTINNPSGGSTTVLGISSSPATMIVENRSGTNQTTVLELNMSRNAPTVPSQLDKISQITSKGDNYLGNLTEYTQIESVIENIGSVGAPTNIDGTLNLNVKTNNVITNYMSLNGSTENIIMAKDVAFSTKNITGINKIGVMNPTATTGLDGQCLVSGGSLGAKYSYTMPLTNFGSGGTITIDNTTLTDILGNPGIGLTSGYFVPSPINKYEVCIAGGFTNVNDVVFLQMGLYSGTGPIVPGYTFAIGSTPYVVENISTGGSYYTTFTIKDTFNMASYPLGPGGTASVYLYAQTASGSHTIGTCYWNISLVPVSQ